MSAVSSTIPVQYKAVKEPMNQEILSSIFNSLETLIRQSVDRLFRREHLIEDGLFTALQRVRDTERFFDYSSDSPYGTYKGRQIIGLGSKIHDGIYIAPARVEAVVVDEKYGSLPTIYEELASKVNNVAADSPYKEITILHETLRFTRSKIKLSPNAAVELRKQFKVTEDQKMTLDLFIEAEKGETRHQVLLAAYLLEKLKINKILSGFVGIDCRGSMAPIITGDEITNASPTITPTERVIYVGIDGIIRYYSPIKSL